MQELHISVRNLVEFIFRAGDIDNRAGKLASAEAMMEGSRIHRKIQKSMDTSYQPADPAEIFHRRFRLHVLPRPVRNRWLSIQFSAVLPPGRSLCCNRRWSLRRKSLRKKKSASSMRSRVYIETLRQWNSRSTCIKPRQCDMRISMRNRTVWSESACR